MYDNYYDGGRLEIIIITAFFIIAFLAVDFLPGEQFVGRGEVAVKQIDKGRYLIVVIREEGSPIRVYDYDGAVWKDVEIGQEVTVSARTGWITQWAYDAKILGE